MTGHNNEVILDLYRDKETIYKFPHREAQPHNGLQ